MSIDIKAPQFPESIAEGSVASWHKRPGEACRRDEVIADIETDKVVLEVANKEFHCQRNIISEEIAK